MATASRRIRAVPSCRRRRNGPVLRLDGQARVALAHALVQREGGADLCRSVQAWYQAAFPGGRPLDRGDGEVLALDGDGQNAVLRGQGAEVRLGIGPDPATARALVG